jgi:diaminopimelate decarboxylase
MSILIELEQFGKPKVGREKFSVALQASKTSNVSSHPVHNWIENAGLAGPTLAFDLNAIESRMCWLADISKSFSVTPLLAVKSCTAPEFLEVAHRNLDGFDVSNIAEYALLDSELGGKVVSVTSPVMAGSPEDFRSKGNDLIVVLDSHLQLAHHLAHESPCDYLLRVQGSSLLEASSPVDSAYYPVTRFGFTVSEVKKLLGDPDVRKNQPIGFHVHHGSEANRLSTYRSITSELAKLASFLGRPVSCINLGGGWHRLSSQDIRDALDHARRLFPQPCTIIFEPGRWYAEPAGYAVGKIVNLSRAGNIVRCTLDLSGKSHLHWSSPSLIHLFEPHHNEGCIVQFFGPSCYESDFIGKYYMPCSADVVADAGLECGKRVVFGSVSTYSVEWNTSFNGIPVADIEWMRL